MWNTTADTALLIWKQSKMKRTTTLPAWAVVDHEYVNVSRNWFYFVNLDSPRVYTEILYEAKALVNYEYNRAVQNYPAKGPAGYYMWVKLTYYENNLVGYLDVQTFVAFTD